MAMGELMVLVFPEHELLMFDPDDDAPCPTYPCLQVQVCLICTLPVCAVHGEAVSPCTEGGWHHGECADECEPCISEEW
jgi:hypothetical protein